jgi:hypothetical protein
MRDGLGPLGEVGLRPAEGVLSECRNEDKW